MRFEHPRRNSSFWRHEIPRLIPLRGNHIACDIADLYRIIGKEKKRIYHGDIRESTGTFSITLREIPVSQFPFVRSSCNC